MRVFIYYNLHRHVWSVKALTGPKKGRVIMHAVTVTLVDAVPKVSEAGRQRVIQERRKNVHAGIVGTLESVSQNRTQRPTGYARASYNPYKGETFYFTDFAEGHAVPESLAPLEWHAVDTAPHVVMSGRDVWVA